LKDNIKIAMFNRQPINITEAQTTGTSKYRSTSSTKKAVYHYVGLTMALK